MKLIPAIKLRIKLLFNYRVHGKYSKIRKNDIFLVSYPKSGNTWLRFLIGNLIHKEKVDFNNFNSIIPDIYLTSKQELDRYHSPRIIKSHERYIESYPKVIYIYRDPRDVVISFYFYHKKYNTNFNDSITEFIQKFINGVDSRYDPWDTHLKEWFNSPLNAQDNILFLKYEDIKTNEFKAVETVAKFLELNADEQEIKQAIDNSSFQKMQLLEKKQSNTSSYLKNSNKAINFVRSGKSEWRKYFTEELKNQFKTKYGNFLIELGYEKDLNW
ncbi:MAG: sulfotransferase domain-containing protein [Bacteroidota bacterium]